MMASSGNGVPHSPLSQDSQLAYQPALPDLTVSYAPPVNQYRYRRLLQYIPDLVLIQLIRHCKQKHVGTIPYSGQGRSGIPLEYDLYAFFLQQSADLIAFNTVCQ